MYLRASVSPLQLAGAEHSQLAPKNKECRHTGCGLPAPLPSAHARQFLAWYGGTSCGSTVIGKQVRGALVQDFLTSAFLMTGRDCFYTREAAAELMAAMCDALGAMDLPQPALHKPLQLWTGKQLMSALIRPSARMQCVARPATRPPAPGWTDAATQALRLLRLVGRLLVSACGACSAAPVMGRCAMQGCISQITECITSLGV